MECINSCLDIFDEILIVDGGTDDGSFDLLLKDSRIRILERKWSDDADWKFLTDQYNFGLQNLTTDWRIKMDSDYCFHENDIEQIKNLFKHDVIGYTFEKCCFNLVDRFRQKTKILLAVNMKMNPNTFVNEKDQFQVGDKIMYDTDYLTSGVKLYVYDQIFKTKENIDKAIYKFAKAAYNKYGIEWGHESEESAIEYIVNLSRAKVDNYPQKVISIDEHPKYMKEKIKDMTEEMFGYSLFGYKTATYFMGEN